MEINMAINGILLLLGLVLLYYGSEWLVRGTAQTAMALLIRPIIIGMTIVAFATSAPELMVSLLASSKGSSGISVGNIIGSNVINIALVLGASAIVKPLNVNRQIVKRELPYMVAASLLFWMLCLDGDIGKIDGIILLSVLATFLGYSILNAKENSNNQKNRRKTSAKDYLFYGFLIVVGLTALATGADLVVKSAIKIAQSLGFSEIFIGLTIVAFGTSLPELATSVVAVAKNQSDISLGNVVGSNLFNICLVMGSVGLFSPMSIDSQLNRFDFPFMLFLSVVLSVLTLFYTSINRIAGFFLVFSFIFYIGFSYWLAL